MRKLLLVMLVGTLAYQQTAPAAAASAAKQYSACELMTLDDAKSLIGADAEAQKEQSYDTHCYYRSETGAAYLHVSTADGHLWTDYKAKGKPVNGVGDEAYFYPDGNTLGNTLMVRKGDTAITINARANNLSDDAIQKQELIYSRKMAARL